MKDKLQCKFFLWAAFAALCVAGPILSVAKAQSDAATVAGKWHFALETEGGPREVDANLQQTGDTVTGTWDKSDVKGTFADGKLTLEFPLNSEEAGPGTMKVAGKLSGDEMTGTWSFQTYDGTFTAKRSKPAA
ncbi:MAG TPA: hypothetical protein VH302_03360 [Bryobacteraceae bacterium]|jgi:hypothetical protein|nr:hypothetical protein [Bryobacteraceae bacterium]